MRKRGSNLPQVGDYNQVLALDLIRQSGALPKRILAERTGLTIQTVSNICQRLIQLGLIRPAARPATEHGARAVFYEIVADSQYAVGLHIDPARMDLVVLDLAGNIVDRTSVATPPGDDPEAGLDAIETSVCTMLRDNMIGVDAVSGLGVSCPGPIDVDAGTLVGPPNLRGWSLLELRNELETRLGLVTVLEKDTIAATTGELWAGRQQLSNFAFIYVGTGVGAGVVLDGEIIRGASKNLGEIGHLSGDPNGPICSCGGRGCVAITTAPPYIVSCAVEAGVLKAVDTKDPIEVAAAIAKLSELAETGTDSAREMLEAVGHAFGRAASNLANALDLEAIVFGGPEWPELSKVVLPIAAREINRLFTISEVHSVEVRQSELGIDVGSVGAASLVMYRTVASSSTNLTLA
ncbi:ROK family transcriptional regulator [Arthrobacter castelli]|uniref:ROK family transcriptional regulator n=1 Tax=Arthrobacter castelli TaxID=271431 RepID=UPI0004282D12|nr:ROK family transcriptional regulator [Arthrobacter castelli]